MNDLFTAVSLSSFTFVWLILSCGIANNVNDDKLHYMQSSNQRTALLVIWEPNQTHNSAFIFDAIIWRFAFIWNKYTAVSWRYGILNFQVVRGVIMSKYKHYSIINYERKFKWKFMLVRCIFSIDITSKMQHNLFHLKTDEVFENT